MNTRLPLLLQLLPLWVCACPCERSYDITFQVEELPETGLHGITFIPGADEVVVAVGDQGTILVRESGEWLTREPVTGAHLRAVENSYAEVIAVGDNGMIARSADRGQTWGVVESGVKQHLYGIVLGDRSFAVGDGVILRSADYGVTWDDPLLLGEPQVLRAVQIGVEAVLAVGDAGSAFLTTNLGETWKKVDVGTDANLTSVGLVPYSGEFNGSFLVAGEMGVLRQMEDLSGENWSVHDLVQGGRLVVSKGGDFVIGTGFLSWLGVVEEPFVPMVGIEPIAVASGGNQVWVFGPEGLVIQLLPQIQRCPAMH